MHRLRHDRRLGALGRRARRRRRGRRAARARRLAPGRGRRARTARHAAAARRHPLIRSITREEPSMAATLRGLEGKNVLITGAAKGQGFSHAKAFADAGADIAALDITEPIVDIYPLATAQMMTETIARHRRPRPARDPASLRHPRRGSGAGRGRQSVGLLRRAHRRARLQRGCRRIGLHPGHARARPRRRDRHDRQRPHVRGQVRGAEHDRARLGQDRQHLVGSHRLRSRDAVPLRRGQARHRGAHVGVGVRARRVRDQRQRRGARHDQARAPDRGPGWCSGWRAWST